jgi:hypothetical protein
VNNELERVRKEAVVAYARYSLGILSDGTEEEYGNFIQECWRPGRGSKRPLPQYKSRALPLRRTAPTLISGEGERHRYIVWWKRKR